MTATRNTYGEVVCTQSSTLSLGRLPGEGEGEGDGGGGPVLLLAVPAQLAEQVQEPRTLLRAHDVWRKGERGEVLAVVPGFEHSELKAKILIGHLYIVIQSWSNFGWPL